jgi:hypothetical protein
MRLSAWGICVAILIHGAYCGEGAVAQDTKGDQFLSERRELLKGEAFSGTRTFCVELVPLRPESKKVALHYHFAFPDIHEEKIAVSLALDKKQIVKQTTSYTEGHILVSPGKHQVTITIGLSSLGQKPRTVFSLFTINIDNAKYWAHLNMCPVAAAHLDDFRLLKPSPK